MASSTLTLYKNNTQTETFALVSTSENSARWVKSGRALSTPFAISQRVKVNKGVSNDESFITTTKTEANLSTAKLATLLIETRISLPKDQTVLTPALIAEAISCHASSLIDGAATGATSVNRTALQEGRII